MPKSQHEIRDPIHVFLTLSNSERRLVDSAPFQRLRHIQQLAMTSLLYPGATHTRFEHSLGVCALAGRVYRQITRADLLSDAVRALLPELAKPNCHPYWERVVRAAALCHDLGHLPFSHAAEHDLLPDGWNHERLTVEMVLGEELRSVFQSYEEGPLEPLHVAKIAVGPAKLPDVEFSLWETILSEIIGGNAFGVDRMDYLLRDSLHAGVPYGHFDHHRLVSTLRVLPSGAEGETPALGVELGGLRVAGELLWARYFMFSQVYFHEVRRVYDIHLKDFLMDWVPGGTFPTNPKEILAYTDNEVWVAMRSAAENADEPGHDAARRICTRQHFRTVYQRNPADVGINPEAGAAVFAALSEKFGADQLRHDRIPQYGGGDEAFPVVDDDEQVGDSRSMSDTLAKLPVISIDYVFAAPEISHDVTAWLDANRHAVIVAGLETELEDE